MTSEEKQTILEYIKALDENLEALKKYQFSLALLKCDQDEKVGQQIKKLADDINELLNLIK